MEKLHRRIDLFSESYWQTLSPDVSSKFEAPSWVIETIAPVSKSLSSILVVCTGGEVLEVEGDLQTVMWRAKVVTSSNPSLATRLHHAAFDSVTCRLYVTAELHQLGSPLLPRASITNGHAKHVNHADELFFGSGTDQAPLPPPPTGIFIADLKQVMHTGASLGPIMVTPFFNAADMNLPSRVEGLAIDSTLRVVFACDDNNQRVHMWPMTSPQRIIFTNENKRKTVLAPRAHGAITLERAFHPFMCATMPSDFLSRNGTMMGSLAVSDYYNSKVYVFEVVVKTGSDDIRDDVINEMHANLIRTVATRGITPGQVLSPRGVAFDPAGNLIVADYGNSRVQMFTAKSLQKPVTKQNSNLAPGSRGTPKTSPRVTPRHSPNASPPVTIEHSGSVSEGTMQPTNNNHAIDALWLHQANEILPKMKSVWMSSKIPKLRSVNFVIDPERRQPSVIVGLYNASEVACYK